MKLLIKLLLILFTFNIFSSCIPDEDPIKPFDRGDVIINNLELGGKYTNQLYFSLKDNNVVKSNNFSVWDLALIHNDEDDIEKSFYFRINYANFMRCKNFGQVNFDDVSKEELKSMTDNEWSYDIPNGNTDSTAIGKWWYEENGQIKSKNDLYAIHLGANDIAESLGYALIRFRDVVDGEISIEFKHFKKRIDSAVVTIDDININKNHTFISLDEENYMLDLEPDKYDWDILFTKYTEIVYTDEGVPTWYGVVGVLINDYNTKANWILNDDFQSIDISILDSLELKSNRNSIGYEWKYFDLDSKKYTVLPEFVYIIKSNMGYYYKLRFVGYVNSSGDPGSPILEFKLL